MTFRNPAGTCLAQAAAQFVDTPFRLNGREPFVGLDCVGLICASLLAIGRRPVAPNGYGLRNTNPERWFEFAYLSGFVDVQDTWSSGDLIMAQPGPAQQHLMIVEDQLTAIHAHAGLKRVVRQPIPDGLATLAHWRLFQK